jgi:hypothetical protein
LGGLHQELTVRQVAGVGGVLGGGGNDDDGDGYPEGEADRGERSPGAGLVAAQVAQRQPHRHGHSGSTPGEQPDRQRADKEHSDDGGEGPSGDEEEVAHVE